MAKRFYIVDSVKANYLPIDITNKESINAKQLKEALKFLDLDSIISNNNQNPLNYILDYDLTSNSTSDTLSGNLTYDKTKGATKIEGILTIKVPKRGNYNVQINCSEINNAIAIINNDGIYRNISLVNVYSFDDVEEIKIQIIGECYVKNILVNMGIHIPNNISELTNDKGYCTITIEDDRIIINNN